MSRSLLPFDGSPAATRALNYLIRQVSSGLAAKAEVHLINVQPLADAWIVHRLLPEAELATMARAYGEAVLAPAVATLTAAGIKVTPHIERGEIASVITQLAADQSCDQIVMGTRGLSTLGDLLLGSIATRVLHLATVPVTFVK
jgi:nucleotide-binding universal stress UspA family protein